MEQEPNALRLQEPLLGIHPHELDTVECGCSAQDPDSSGDSDKAAPDTEITSSDTFVIWILVPLLLFLQFGMTYMLIDGKDMSLDHYWPVASTSIVLFVISSWLYRHACRDLEITNAVAILLPEVLTDIILILCFLDKVLSAVVLMLGSTICLVLFAVISRALRMLSAVSSNASDEDSTATTTSLLEASREIGFTAEE